MNWADLYLTPAPQSPCHKIVGAALLKSFCYPLRLQLNIESSSQGPSVIIFTTLSSSTTPQLTPTCNRAAIRCVTVTSGACLRSNLRTSEKQSSAIFTPPSLLTGTCYWFCLHAQRFGGAQCIIFEQYYTLVGSFSTKVQLRQFILSNLCIGKTNPSLQYKQYTLLIRWKNKSVSSHSIVVSL